jgi:hypothetical protein
MHAPVIPFQIDYVQILVLALWMGFFVKGARMDLRSPLLWGSLSLGLWLLFTQVFGGGLLAGCFSQLLLIAGLTAREIHLERRKARRDDPSR